jgi:type III secretory pathway component EscR
MDKDDKEKIRTISYELSEMLLKVALAVKEYAAMSYRTPDEEMEYQKLIEVLKAGTPAIQQVRDFLGEELYRNAVAYFYSIKEKARAGDETALAIYNDLAPDFEKILMSQVDKN